MTKEQAIKRGYITRKNTNLKLVDDKTRQKTLNKRASFRKKQTKQLKRLEVKLRSNGVNRLQGKLSDRQLLKRQKQITKNIAKRDKLKYNKLGGDIALSKTLDEHKWQTNFFSSNVWKFKIRGKNLRVAYLDGSVYEYFGVANLFLGMLRAGSKGKYVWRQLRKRDIPFIKVK